MSDPQVSHYLCIGCPLGCRLEVEHDETDAIVEVRGWSCKKGERYGRQEDTDPRRMVSTTVHVTDAPLPRLPVKTSESIPKGMVTEVCRSLQSLSVKAPVRLGDVVAANVCGCGADIVATRDLG